MSRPARATTLTYALVSAAFMAAGGVMAAWSLYPVYESTAFIAVAAASIAAGAIIVVVSDRLGWNGFVVAGLTFAAYVGIGLGLAIPSFTNGDTTLVAALGELARSPITGWKDVVTLAAAAWRVRCNARPAARVVAGWHRNFNDVRCTCPTLVGLRRPHRCVDGGHRGVARSRLACAGAGVGAIRRLS